MRRRDRRLVCVYTDAQKRRRQPNNAHEYSVACRPCRSLLASSSTVVVELHSGNKEASASRQVGSNQTRCVYAYVIIPHTHTHTHTHIHNAGNCVTTPKLFFIKVISVLLFLFFFFFFFNLNVRVCAKEITSRCVVCQKGEEIVT